MGKGQRVDEGRGENDKCQGGRTSEMAAGEGGI